MNPIRRALASLMALLLLSPALFAADLKEAMDQAALELKGKPKIEENSEKAIIIQVVNLHNKKTDQVAKKIETELYLALEKHFPKFKLVFLSESIAGVNLMKALMVKGEYEQKGETTTVRFAALNGLQGEVIAQASVEFATEQKTKESLVAVLDIEATYLNPDQVKAFSDMFRAALINVAQFNLASSADVSKMDPDKIQKAYGCSRDECATIIGEQLGVDRVISTSLFKITDNKYMLSSKIMDIQNGAILISKTIKHDSDLSSLDVSLEVLAGELAGKEVKLKVEPAPAQEVSESSGGTSWLSHVLAGGGALVFSQLSVGAASTYNTLATDNQDLKTQYDASNSTSERDTIKAKYDTNQSEMTAAKADVSLYDSLTVVFALWEGYLIFFGGDSSAMGEAPKSPYRWAMLPSNEPGRPALAFQMSF
ncbi:MAG: hypothetical protein A2527_12440 [Candidatus Lambdaproteobacteria bacterium RIFOXYD2_FULL_50_16]|uniref:Flagellar assembly protein T N-terminal domain-containing protein n=1 Tax=Candidatus Lambdaproteobacteria bacterium RIFOXYD2_FULL_50_16 TaxID=1817772 RepID=A0A1F6GA96_9PROT|nr:MAG: hypothetical protein A2527_12440 [Candidatus Lambdaproteobacteria bacterium RIFOXYD2_FULL_50_16]